MAEESEKNNHLELIASIVGVIIIIVVLAGGYFYLKQQNKPGVPAAITGATTPSGTIPPQDQPQASPTAPAPLTEAQLAIVAEVSVKVPFPQTEQPMVMEITDLTQTQNQPFLKDAKIGDFVIAYLQSGKAVVYRPSSKEIINWGGVTSSNPSQTPLPAQPEAPQGETPPPAEETPPPIIP